MTEEHNGFFIELIDRGLRANLIDLGLGHAEWDIAGSDTYAVTGDYDSDCGFDENCIIESREALFEHWSLTFECTDIKEVVYAKIQKVEILKDTFVINYVIEE